MPTVTPPSSPYLQAMWQADPKNKPQPRDGKPGYEKYDYIMGETLDSIAMRLSQPGQTVTADEITQLNWGTTVTGEINYYLHNYNGCQAESSSTATLFPLRSTDPQPWLWVPKVAPRPPSGKFRSPGKADVGHVAPDGNPSKHINTLVVPPVYAITLELGDIDAIFDPMNPATDAVAPWNCLGVRQRLQVLGYLYTPLAHSRILAHAEKCWKYYKMVHDRRRGALLIHSRPVASQTAATVAVNVGSLVLTVTGGANAGVSTLNFADPDKNTLDGMAAAVSALNRGWTASITRNASAPSANLVATAARDANGYANQKMLLASNLSHAELFGILKTEVQNNLLTRSFPKSGVVYQNSQLPPKGEFAAIRVPGGYMSTWPRAGVQHSKSEFMAGQSPVDADKPFDAKIGQDLAEFEEKLAACADLKGLLAKIPIIAHVNKLLPDGRMENAAGVSVYFQLADPVAPTPDNNTHAPDKAPVLRDTFMEYQKDPNGWASWKPNPVKVKSWVPPPPPVTGIGAPPPPMMRPPPVMPTAADWLRGKQLAPAAQQAVATGAVPDLDTYLAALGETPVVKGVIEYVVNEYRRESAPRGILHRLFEWGNASGPPYESGGNGPRLYVDNILTGTLATATSLRATDPQCHNAPHAVGGKGGQPVAGNIFEVTSRDGFHTRRSTLHRDYGSLAVAEAVQPAGGFHEDAVRCQTNDQGYAGVVFVPSRCGGDTYRLRAYIGPETLQFPTTADFSGEDPTGPLVETGTMVVWRNVRLYRYIQHRLDVADYAPEVQALFTWADTNVATMLDGRPSELPATTNWWNWTINTRTRLDGPSPDLALFEGDPPEQTFPSVPRANAYVYRPVNNLQFIPFWQNLRRGYCELISDTGRSTPEPMSDQLMRDARTAGIAAANGCHGLPFAVDWNTLWLDLGARSPFMFTMRHPKQYNAMVGTTQTHLVTGDDFNTIQYILKEVVPEAMNEMYSDGGVYPGFTLVQFPHGDTWDHHTLNSGGLCSSGYCYGRRTVLLFYTRPRYETLVCYSATANVAHEFGHGVMRPHQAPNTGGNEDIPFHQIHPEAYCRPQPREDVCVMSYSSCYGEYCGRCVLALRGWKSKNL